MIKRHDSVSTKIDVEIKFGPAEEDDAGGLRTDQIVDIDVFDESENLVRRFPSNWFQSEASQLFTQLNFITDPEMKPIPQLKDKKCQY